MATKPVFVVTAHYADGHGDVACVLLVTRDMQKALKRASNSDALGYRGHFRSVEHGMEVSCLTLGRSYLRPPSRDSDYPTVVFFCWNDGRFKAEWNDGTIDRLGLFVPRDLKDDFAR